MLPAARTTRVPALTLDQSGWLANTYLPPPSVAMLLLKSLMTMPRRSTGGPLTLSPVTSNSTRSVVALWYLLIATVGVVGCSDVVMTRKA